MALTVFKPICIIFRHKVHHLKGECFIFWALRILPENPLTNGHAYQNSFILERGLLTITTYAFCNIIALPTVFALRKELLQPENADIAADLL
jgi:hypothetical protein